MKSSIIITIALVNLFFSCKNQPQETEKIKTEITKKATPDDVVELTPEQVKNSGITMGVPEKKEMHTTIKVNGVIDVPPQNMVSVSIPLGGYLKRTALVPGATVSRGSILATLEDQQYIQIQQDYLTAKSKLEYAQADFNRQKALNETKSTSDKVFQLAKAEFEAQKIMVRSLEEKLRLIGIAPEKLNEDNISRSINIYSPINGYVTKVNVNIGKYVTPSDVLFELIDPGDLHVRLTVFENDASNLAVGQKITCTTNSRPNEKYNATIHLITPNIDEDRATEVHCHLDKYDKRLLPGTFMNAAIELNNASVTVVPEEAVVKWENKFYLFSQESENRFKLIAVETGVSNDGFVEIKTVIPPTNIITKNAYTILMKMKNSAEEG